MRNMNIVEFHVPTHPPTHDVDTIVTLPTLPVCGIAGRTWENIASKFPICYHYDPKKGTVIVASSPILNGSEVFRLCYQQAINDGVIEISENLPIQYQDYAFWTRFGKHCFPGKEGPVPGVFAFSEPDTDAGQSVNAIVTDYRHPTKALDFVGVFVSKDLKTGEEITICYGNDKWGSNDNPYAHHRREYITAKRKRNGREGGSVTRAALIMQQNGYAMRSIHLHNPSFGQCSTTWGSKQCTFCQFKQSMKTDNAVEVLLPYCKACVCNSHDGHTCGKTNGTGNAQRKKKQNVNIEI